MLINIGQGADGYADTDLLYVSEPSLIGGPIEPHQSNMNLVPFVQPVQKRSFACISDVPAESVSTEIIALLYRF